MRLIEEEEWGFTAANQKKTCADLKQSSGDKNGEGLESGRDKKAGIYGSTLS